MLHGAAIVLRRFVPARRHGVGVLASVSVPRVWCEQHSALCGSILLLSLRNVSLLFAHSDRMLSAACQFTPDNHAHNARACWLLRAPPHPHIHTRREMLRPDNHTHAGICDCDLCDGLNSHVSPMSAVWNEAPITRNRHAPFENTNTLAQGNASRSVFASNQAGHCQLTFNMSCCHPRPVQNVVMHNPHTSSSIDI